ncbi:hypothetical protein XENORESO_000579 [Xenotaenia resolanae]|uniref:Uncharacterized protein n=1 Tax=Xenotaenia resolanae TaxID=208358 RepID=A0ABV0VNI3_9TELE
MNTETKSAAQEGVWLSQQFVLMVRTDEHHMMCHSVSWSLFASNPTANRSHTQTVITATHLQVAKLASPVLRVIYTALSKPAASSVLAAQKICHACFVYRRHLTSLLPTSSDTKQSLTRNDIEVR